MSSKTLTEHHNAKTTNATIKLFGVTFSSVPADIFKRGIALCVIRWIVIYPVDSDLSDGRSFALSLLYCLEIRRKVAKVDDTKKY